MAVKKYKPTSPGRRGMTSYTFEEITKTKPERSLVKKLSKNAGRNSYGRVTVWHRGGGHKRKLRIVDFKRNKHNIPAIVNSIEYDPNRNARIALLHFTDGDLRSCRRGQSGNCVRIVQYRRTAGIGRNVQDQIDSNARCFSREGRCFRPAGNASRRNSR